eukprot:scaffold300832_cov32-Tisochrysis_lutea.AAC.4
MLRGVEGGGGPTSSASVQESVRPSNSLRKSPVKAYLQRSGMDIGRITQACPHAQSAKYWNTTSGC